MKPVEKKRVRWRTLTVGLLFAVFFILIGAKAVYLQIFQGSWLSQKAADQYEKSIVSNGKRGTIFDAKRKEMAVSVNVTSIAAHPAGIQDPAAAAKALANALKMDAKALTRKLSSPEPFVWIKRQVTPRETNAVKALSLEGVVFKSEQSRFYPNKALAAQIIGFSGIDGTGLEGVEFLYDTYLKRSAGKFTVFKDALGRGFDAELNVVSDYSGHDLTLTIDQTVQYITEQALEEAVKEFSAKSGIAVVMDPKTGAVLALAHFPFFNPNSFGDFTQEFRRNRAITDPFEPGSTMKIFSAAAALETGISTPNTIFFCENGTYRIGENIIHDTTPRGWLTLQQIVKYSSNIGIVKVSEMIGPEALYKTLRDFSFGEKTGIDCPGETAGVLIPYNQWSKIDAGAISFGQGISASAIQLITAASAIANDGILMKPYIVQTITDKDGKIIKTREPQRVRRVISKETARILKMIMNSVTHNGGTGVNAALAGYSVSGKTGTAQKTDAKGTYAKGKYLASFIGFTPAEDPALAILVIVNEPAKQHYGGIVATPAFRKIAHETLNYMNIPPNIDTNRLTVSRDNGAKG